VFVRANNTILIEIMENIPFNLKIKVTSAVPGIVDVAVSWLARDDTCGK